jgi:hypothetical protein
MRRTLLPVVLALAMLAGCASSLPVRDFRGDYGRVWSSSAKIDGYPPFAVYELKEQRRLQVRLNLIAQVFGPIGDPLQMMGLSDGIPPQSAHEAAARQYLADTGRTACTVTGSAISPSGREFEFTYAC